MPGEIHSFEKWRIAMTALTHAVSRIVGIQIDVRTLKPALMIFGASLFVSLMLATYGLDLSPGFF